MTESPGLSRSLGDRLFLSLYFGSHKVPSAFCAVLRAADAGIKSAVVGTWLGVLTPGMMRKLDEWYYTRGFGMYRENDYNRSGLYDWEEKAVREHFMNCKAILIPAGAGGGREMLALNRMGLRVDGFEYNPGLVEVGNSLLTEDGFEPTLFQGPANAVPPGSKQYDGAIVGWGTYTLISGRNMRIALLRQIRSRCVAGSPLLISFFHRPGNTRPYRMEAGIANAIRTVLRRSKVEIGDTLSVSYAHRFTEQEIREELAAGGFAPVSFQIEPYAHAVAIAV